MSTPERILLIRLSSVGDILLATPVAQMLRRQHPGAHITWLVDDGYADLVRHNPNLDRVAVFEFTGRHRGPGGIRALADELKPVDLLVDLQHKVRTVLLSFYLRPGTRLVLTKRKGAALVRAILGQDPILRGPHQVERNLALLAGDGNGWRTAGEPDPLPLLRAGEPDLAEARKLLPDLPRDPPRVGIFAGARHRTKRWPTRHLAALADRCRVEGLLVVLLGGEEDAFLTEAVLHGMESPPTPAHTSGSLGLLAALIAQCQVVVSPDSGPAHMAAALGVPVVAIFGPTSPDRWAPRLPGAQVVRLDLPCSPCSNHGGDSCRLGTLECLEQLQPELVWAAVRRALAGKEA